MNKKNVLAQAFKG